MSKSFEGNIARAIQWLRTQPPNEHIEVLIEAALSYEPVHAQTVKVVPQQQARVTVAEKAAAMNKLSKAIEQMNTGIPSRVTKIGIVNNEQSLIDLVAAKFRSGNSVPVERVTITRAEFDATRAAIAPLLAAQPMTFANTGDSEATFIADAEHLNCPMCGGSGHIDDVAATPT